MNLFDFILMPFSKAHTSEPKSHVWDPETVTMQKPTAPEPPSTKTSTAAPESSDLNLRGGGEAGEVCCGVSRGWSLTEMGPSEGLASRAESEKGGDSHPRTLQSHICPPQQGSFNFSCRNTESEIPQVQTLKEQYYRTQHDLVLDSLGDFLSKQVHEACVSLYLVQSLSTPIRAQISTEPSAPRQRAHNDSGSVRIRVDMYMSQNGIGIIYTSISIDNYVVANSKSRIFA
ncbi:uncharacterized protein BO87DRAFT_387149 [Aspergillus neoniger CBS 115656]|uniref:Uncharacterized protein n=1 Tax=Aspergillus neoniger (strain CBS 115656) TaxID=1448310 RepID=A0A318Z0R6_ASPNB|nr:hypothetical protein BO87DRAFT_387149 [Aspergillus neoniger CBS 115656]PYH33718.1 hypothetical protein BO87DRAFT_387149 [Aspergillus neoniger CBS 115656]